MTEKDELKRWVELQNARGFAGAGARESEDEKLIVERSEFGAFADTAQNLLAKTISDVRQEQPPLPDFSMRISERLLHVELTEFIDPEFVKQAKAIRKSPDHPLHDGGLWFETSQEWFSNLLKRCVEKKERKYQDRGTKIDILLVWNEALQVGIEDTDHWLEQFQLPPLNNIEAVYFQSWYHPNYLARPTWSIKAHTLIGDMRPKLVVP